MIRGVLTTAAPLTAEQQQKIEKGFTDNLGDTVLFEIMQDPSLVGGFTAIINGVVYDASVKAQLEGMGRFIKG